MPVLYKEIGEQLTFTFWELSEEAQERAMQEILTDDELNLQESISKYKATIKKCLHAHVNYRAMYQSLVRRKKHLKKANENEGYLMNYISSNVCNFLADGTYVRFLT